jgi:hypothetical protein
MGSLHAELQTPLVQSSNHFLVNLVKKGKSSNHFTLHSNAKQSKDGKKVQRALFTAGGNVRRESS